MKRLAVPLGFVALLGCAAARRVELERLERIFQSGARESEREDDPQGALERLAARIETPEEKARVDHLFLRLGRALRGAKRFDEALKVQRRVAQETEAGLSFRARLEMAETFREQGNHGGAMEVLRLLESSWDGRFALTARYHMALVELQRNRPEEALGLMGKAALDRARGPRSRREAEPEPGGPIPGASFREGRRPEEGAPVVEDLGSVLLRVRDVHRIDDPGTGDQGLRDPRPAGRDQ